MVMSRKVLRIGVIGSDISACAFTGFIKRKLPSASVCIFTESSELCHDIPKKGVTFSSPWIRNDKKGRIAIQELGRDILGLAPKEFIVSDVKASSCFSLMPEIGVTGIKFPSFRAMIRNMFSIGLEPLRRTLHSTDSSSSLSVYEFISNRFSERFAKRYSNALTRYFFASDDSKSVSVHMAFPKMMRNYTVHGSVLLGPFMSVFSSWGNSSSNQTADVLDPLWQEMMTGGKFVSMSSRLDLSEFRDMLVHHIKCSLSGVEIVDEKEIEVKTPQDGKTCVLWGSKECRESYECDVIVTSRNAREIMKLFSVTDEKTDWADRLSQSREVICTRFQDVVCREGKLHIFEQSQWINTSESSNIIGGVSPSLLFPGKSSHLVVDVFSHTPLTDSEMEIFPQRVAENREHIPSPGLSYAEDMMLFNKWRREIYRNKKVDVEVVGKWFYCPSGSISDQIFDAFQLANRLSERYEDFPKSVENDVSHFWINRNDRCLDLKYSPFQDSYRKFF